jgi:hypothetical protein
MTARRDAVPALRTAGPARRIALMLAFALALAAGGCLFQARDADNWDGTPGPPWVPPHFLGNQLGNMKRALESKPPVLTNYGRAFRTGPIVMQLDAADLADTGDTEFEDWSSTKEEQRMSGILNQAGATLTVAWTLSDSLDVSASERYYDKLGYRLTFSRGGASAVYSGTVRLTFEDDGTGSWYITSWEDERDNSGNHTWGWLRARNRVEFPLSRPSF